MLIPLRVFSSHSLLKSSITYEQAIEYCQNEKLPHIGIANENSMFGLFKWTQSFTKKKLKTITGTALKVGNGFVWTYCLNETGFIELSHLLTQSYLKHNGTLQVQDIHLPNCILMCDLSISEEEIVFLSKKNFVTIALSRQKRDELDEPVLLEIANKLNLHIVAAPKCYFSKKEMHLDTDCLWCIKNATYVQEDDRPNVFEDEYLKTQAEYAEDFKDIPWAITNSEIIAQKCNFQIKPHAPRMPEIGVENAQELFEKKVWIGFEKRLNQNILNKIPEKHHDEQRQLYKERLEYEIDVISRMKFCEYFLIVSEIVQWTKNNGILVGPGRGSGAGSLVAYSLEITSINPIQFELMFERFLNPDRVSLPDFDIDFCQKNRHKVIHFIKERFGEECVSHIATFGSLQYRAALRDIGRVLQLPYGMIDDLCKKLPAPFQGKAPTLKELRENKISTELMNEENELLFKIAENIEGLPRHSSMHAAGVIITNRQIADICPMFKEEGVDMPITQFDMKEAEAVGLVKFDILGLTMLSTISQTLDFLKDKNISVDLENLDLTDQKLFEMLTEGKTNSIFQLDSPGMRQVLKEMKPNCFEDIVATTSLYRPGPMAEIPRFIASKNGSTPIVYEYPELEPILSKTYGVTVYQEQVLAIAKELAGYSLKEADLLRRAMGKKIHEEMELNKKKFVEGVLKKKGKENDTKEKEKAELFFDNLAHFASYGFNKAHAAAYSMITYQNAYLKYYHTIEFLCSSLIFEMNAEKASDILQEVLNFGIKLFPPDINKSNVNFDIINESIYFGLSKVKGVGETASLIIENRKQHGPFTSLRNFINRISPNKRALENLIYSGAFNQFNSNRALLLDEMQNKNPLSISLFDDFIEETKPLTDIEIAIEELDKLGYIFSNKFLALDLKHFKIFNSMFDIEHIGLIYVFGIKPIIKNTKDGKKIFAYEFFEKQGIQRLFANELFELKLDLCILEVEKLPNRYIIKKLFTIPEYCKRFKKIFVSEDCIENLLPGETSIFLHQENNKHKHLGDFAIDMNFLTKNKQFLMW